MQMSLKTIVQSLVPMRWQRTRKGEPLSIVLLLRKAHLFTAAEIQLAAERAWHRSFDGDEKESMHCVKQMGTAMLMKAGPHLINFFYYPRPYVENPKENIEWLSHPSQRQAWIQHSGCLGVDYMNHGVSVELGYCVLSQLVAEMLDGNCTGIYIPRERSLIPNDDSLYLELRKLGSACESGINLST
jgi:hypothetical protein